MRLFTDDAWAVATIWQEAQGEGYAGMLAVAEVIWRRTCKKYASDGTVVDTCLKPYQFSGWNSKSPLRTRAALLDDDDRIVAQCKRAWRQVWEQGSHTTLGAVLYHADTLPKPWPAWATDEAFIVQIGHHRFYQGENDPP